MPGGRSARPSCQVGDVTAQRPGSPSCGAAPLPSAGSQGPGGDAVTLVGVAVRLCELRKLLPSHLFIHSFIL